MACLKIKYRTSANEYLEGGNRYNIPGARLCCIYFCLFRWYHCLWTVQINISDHAKVTLQTEGLSDVVQSLFSRSALAGRPENVLSLRPEPALGGPV